jgi:uncharacterized protein YecT (DUF1311 family)
VLLLLLPMAAAAEGTDGIRACMADADTPAACIGTLSRDCIAAREDGETTLGMTECIAEETAAWDALLNAQYAAIMDLFRMQDASGDVLGADLTREATLRAAQRAWIRFRDADCTMQAARYGQGSLGRVAAANCVMGMTAERTIELMAMEGP